MKNAQQQPVAHPSAMAQAIERINELEAEVRVLKRALAEAHGNNGKSERAERAVIDGAI